MPILELNGKISQACLIQFVLLCRVLLLITKKTPACIYVCDINPNMPSVGKKRAAERGLKHEHFNIFWHLSMGSVVQHLTLIFRLQRGTISQLDTRKCRSSKFWGWIYGWLYLLPLGSEIWDTLRKLYQKLTGWLISLEIPNRKLLVLLSWVCCELIHISML